MKSRRSDQLSFKFDPRQCSGHDIHCNRLLADRPGVSPAASLGPKVNVWGLFTPSLNKVCLGGNIWTSFFVLYKTVPISTA